MICSLVSGGAADSAGCFGDWFGSKFFFSSSASELARLSGVSAGYIRHLEAGSKKLSGTMAGVLGQSLGASGVCFLDMAARKLLRLTKNLTLGKSFKSVPRFFNETS